MHLKETIAVSRPMISSGKASSVGDHLGIKVTGDGGSWQDNSGYKLKKGTTKVSITLDEIGA